MKLSIALLLCSAATVSGFSKLRACAGFNYDECGVCRGPGRTPGTCDCDGTLPDCLGICAGSAYVDVCGVCNGKGISSEPVGDDNDALPCDCAGHTLDCAGQCGGNHFADACGECLAPEDHVDNGPDECKVCHNDDQLGSEGSFYTLPSNPEHPNWNQDQDCGGVCDRGYVENMCSGCGPKDDWVQNVCSGCGPKDDWVENACTGCGPKNDLVASSCSPFECVDPAEVDALKDDCGYCPEQLLELNFVPGSYDACNCIGSGFNCFKTCDCPSNTPDHALSSKGNNCGGKPVVDECGVCDGPGGDKICNCKPDDKTCVPPRFSLYGIYATAPDPDNGSYKNVVTVEWGRTTLDSGVEALGPEEFGYALNRRAFLEKNAIVGLEFQIKFVEASADRHVDNRDYDEDATFLKKFVFEDDYVGEMDNSVHYFGKRDKNWNAGFKADIQNCIRLDGTEIDDKNCWDFMKPGDPDHGYEYKIRAVACPRSTFEDIPGCEGLSEEDQVALFANTPSADYEILDVVAENCVCDINIQKVADWSKVMAGEFRL